MLVFMRTSRNSMAQRLCRSFGLEDGPRKQMITGSNPGRVPLFFFAFFGNLVSFFFNFGEKDNNNMTTKATATTKTTKRIITTTKYKNNTMH